MVHLLERLGVTGEIRPDLAGLHTFYGAWSAAVPMDNIRKMIALRTDAAGPLPGDDADDYFDAFLAHGTGATCWASANALFTALERLGFSPRRAVGSMFDMGVDNHGTVIVTLDEVDWLIDGSVLTKMPLPLKRGEPAIFDFGHLHYEVDPDGEQFVIWSPMPPLPFQFPCRLLEFDVPRSRYSENHERSRTMGRFNDRLYVRKNFPDALRVFEGSTLLELNDEGLTSRALSESELVDELTGRFGYSAAIIEEWVAAGCMAATIAPRPSGTLPPPKRVPPSERATSIAR